MQSPWYVIHCETNRDRQVERLVALQGVEAFAPRIPATRKRNGDKPLFPSYVFARLDLDSGIWGRLRYLAGMRGLVEIGGGPCPLDAGIVTAIRNRVEGWASPADPLRAGERVRVVGGSFADLEGLVCETLNGGDRVAILLDMMRREVRVEIDTESLERAGRGAAA